MTTMQQVVLIGHTLIAILIIVLVLMQRGKGADAGAGFRRSGILELLFPRDRDSRDRVLRQQPDARLPEQPADDGAHQPP